MVFLTYADVNLNFFLIIRIYSFCGLCVVVNEKLRDNINNCYYNNY